MGESSHRLPTSIIGRSHTNWIVLVVLILLLLSYLFEFLLLRHYQSDWERIAAEKAQEQLRLAVRTYEDIQARTFQVSLDLARNQHIIDALNSPHIDRAAMFDMLGRVSREEEVGIELYDARASLIAWEGASEPSHLSEVQTAIDGRTVSYVTRAALTSQLFIAIPVKAQDSVIGAVLVRRTLEWSYALNNRLISSSGIAKRLSHDLGTPVLFDFNRNGTVRLDGRYVSATLLGIDSAKVGIVSVERPSPSVFLQGVAGSFHKVQVAGWALFVFLILISLSPFIKAIPSGGLRLGVVTLLIWSTRYALLFIDVPSTLIQSGIFNPVHFASPFGGGLAKSIGDLFLTVSALVVNVVMAGRYFLTKSGDGSVTSRHGKTSARVVLALLITVLIFLLLRSFAAVIQSAVFDSTLSFNDPMVIVPGFEVAMMLIALFLFGCCLLATVVALSMVGFRLLLHAVRRQNLAWIVLAAMFGAVATTLSFIPSDPLVSLIYRLIFAAGVLAFSYLLHRQTEAGIAVVRTGNVLVLGACVTAMCYSLLDANLRERDRQRIEQYSLDIVRPADGWLKFILDDALQGFASNDVANTILAGESDALEALAFDRWARSSVAKEGYACLFVVKDTSGVELSRFLIGGQTPLDLRGYLEPYPPGTKASSVTWSGEGASAVRVYSGSIPIVDSTGEVIAFGQVVIAASQLALFRGESPSVLRSESTDEAGVLNRPVMVSEFHNGRLFTTSNTEMPLGYTLPSSVLTLFADSASTSMWVDENIEGKGYETLYLKKPLSPGEVIAIGMPQLDFAWHLLSFLKLLVYYSVVVLVLGAGVVAIRWFMGYRYRITFRDRLLVALLITALVPLIAIAAYGRLWAKQRVIDTTSRRLQQETSTLGVSILQRLLGEEGIVQEALNRYTIDQLASEAGADFNLYVGNQLQASSRPELYDAGILDKRLSGTAFANTVLSGRRFFVQTETIGSYEFAVGYRLLVRESGDIVGIVAVPTLYRYQDVESELARRNAIIFSMYAVIVLLVIIMATALANRIAAPIHQLTVATKRVARGETDITLDVKNPDRDIGELIKSFETMTRELERSRDELVRAERELAWKEMARQVAHEIKNPLTPMKLSMQHLRQTYRDKVKNFDQVFEDVSRTIIEQIDALSRIAGEFAHFARLPKPHIETVDVNGILREAVALFEREPHVRFDVALDTGVPALRADKDELRRAFINIIRNGIQAMHGAGTITIQSHLRDNDIVVTIRDTGSGISDEAKAKLFEPNFSTKTDGMGLGLAITRKIIDDLGGNISIESVVDAGTTVTVVLPSETASEGPA